MLADFPFWVPTLRSCALLSVVHSCFIASNDFMEPRWLTIVINLEEKLWVCNHIFLVFLRQNVRGPSSWDPGVAEFVFQSPRSRELRTQKLKSHLVRTQSLHVLPLKPGVGQYIAIHATLTARDFFLAYFYTSDPITCIFSKASPEFSLCWLWLAHGSCVGSQNKMGHPAGCRFPCRVPAEYK